MLLNFWLYQWVKLVCEVMVVQFSSGWKKLFGLLLFVVQLESVRLWFMFIRCVFWKCFFIGIIIILMLICVIFVWISFVVFSGLGFYVCELVGIYSLRVRFFSFRVFRWVWVFCGLYLVILVLLLQVYEVCGSMDVVVFVVLQQMDCIRCWLLIVSVSVWCILGLFSGGLVVLKVSQVMFIFGCSVRCRCGLLCRIVNWLVVG